MDQKVFDELQRTLNAEGAPAAIDRLCARLRETKDYASLFYALLLKKRHELGVSPMPTGSAQNLPASAHAPYEEGIRQASRLVGGLYLDDGNLPQAYAYFRMINEPEPVTRALDTYQPRDDEDMQPLVGIAFYEGAHPRRGFDWILERSGICSAITTLSSAELPHAIEVKQYCIQQLVRALYQELYQRLKAEVVQRTKQEPAVATIRGLLTNCGDSFEEGYAHIDISHLGSVVQMSINLPRCEELALARELCEYGQRLQLHLQYTDNPPFEDMYRAYGLYLAALAGDQVDEAIAYFREQMEKADPETTGTYPAEVLVNLLLKLDRPTEALAVAREKLANVDNRRLSCPSIAELCEQAGDYRTLAEVAREQGDPVHFMAGLLAARK